MFFDVRILVQCVLDCVGVPEGIYRCTTGERTRRNDSVKENKYLLRPASLVPARLSFRVFSHLFFSPFLLNLGWTVFVLACLPACASRDPAKSALVDIGPSNAVIERPRLCKLIFDNGLPRTPLSRESTYAGMFDFKLTRSPTFRLQGQSLWP